MAIYEYVCMGCGNEFELMRPMSESGKPAACPGCKRPAQKRVSSFGSKTGFYVKVPEKAPFRKTIVKPARVKAKVQIKPRAIGKTVAKATTQSKNKTSRRRTKE